MFLFLKKEYKKSLYQEKFLSIIILFFILIVFCCINKTFKVVCHSKMESLILITLITLIILNISFMLQKAIDIKNKIIIEINNFLQQLLIFFEK